MILNSIFPRVVNKMLLLYLSILSLLSNCRTSTVNTRSNRSLQPEHEKPQIDKWMDAFFGKYSAFDQVPSLANLVNLVSSTYLKDCTPIILYDTVVENNEGLILEQLFRHYPLAYKQGQITPQYNIQSPKMLKTFDTRCIAYVLFVADVMRCMDVIGEQSENRVVIVARCSQWRVYEFLASEMSRVFVNLLVIAQSEKIIDVGEELPFILYTHRLYIDGIGSSEPYVLTSWMRGNFTRPTIDLFPRKIADGFSGHRFVIAVANQPPFVIKRGMDENDDTEWDGIEVRLVELLSKMYNFTTDLREARNADRLGSGDAVTEEVRSRRANIGIAGIYSTANRIAVVDVTHSHSFDCAAFITLTSTALPRYRAIMGPFHWTVWLAITCTYLFAIFPISFSDRHSFKHLIRRPEEIENMFWYVFGKFTNAFSFTGVESWDKSNKVTTRILVGFYWIFTIITTACYTGSIIAFVTLPIYPQTIDTLDQLLNGRFQFGTLDKGGWQYWFENSSDPTTITLMKKMEYVPDVKSGLKNTTRAFFWPYAFLGSRGELDYIVRTNFTTMSKRTLLHISNDCFVPYGVSVIFTLNAAYKTIFNMGMLQAWQAGFIIKFQHDVEWETMRSSTGKLLQANSGNSLKSLSYEDRALTLDDTQGMFLLLALGFILGGLSLLSEWLGGCVNLCKRKLAASKLTGRRKSSIASSCSIASNPRTHDEFTPREKINSIAALSNTTAETNHIDEDGINRHETAAEIAWRNSIDKSADDANDSFETPTHERKRLEDEISRLFDIDYILGEIEENLERKLESEELRSTT